MKVLITGGNGFIARSLAESLSDEHDIVSCNRQQLNLLDAPQVSDCIKSNHFDVVIHTATYDAAPAFSKKDPARVLENNLKMFFNVARCEQDFGKMIYFGSGAEFSRPHWKPKMSEEDFDQHVPEDQYGFSKYIMTKYALKSRNIYNLRLFGLFGKYDDWRYRFIPNACARAVLGLPIKIRQNKRFDFMAIDDLSRIVRWVIQDRPRQKVYNVCSGRAFEFKELARKIIDLSGKQLELQTEQDGFGGEYSGDNSSFLTECKGFQFTSIDESIISLYRWYDSNKHILNADEIL
jgi:GDP-L-fucose synthase